MQSSIQRVWCVHVLMPQLPYYISLFAAPQYMSLILKRSPDLLPFVLISCTTCRLKNQPLLFGQPSVIISLPQFPSVCHVFCSIHAASINRMKTYGSVYNAYGPISDNQVSYTERFLFATTQLTNDRVYLQQWND